MHIVYFLNLLEIMRLVKTEIEIRSHFRDIYINTGTILCDIKQHISIKLANITFGFKVLFQMVLLNI